MLTLRAMNEMVVSGDTSPATRGTKCFLTLRYKVMSLGAAYDILKWIVGAPGYPFLDA